MLPRMSTVPESSHTGPHDLRMHVPESDLNEAWDSSSIASSRPGSPSPSPLLQTAMDAPVLPEPECAGRDLSLPAHSEPEPEPVPGLVLCAGRRRAAVDAPSQQSVAVSAHGEPPSHARSDCPGAHSVAVSAPGPKLRDVLHGDSPAPRAVSRPDSAPGPPRASPRAIDSSHARPSLNMTSQEFSEAKAIILDLLGWGVPAEYLINCGLARESIYYAFTEMNLRLPSNLNVEGIVPYEPIISSETVSS